MAPAQGIGSLFKSIAYKKGSSIDVLFDVDNDAMIS